MSAKTDALDYLESNGPAESDTVADRIGASPGHTRRVLNQLKDDDDVAFKLGSDGRTKMWYAQGAQDHADADDGESLGDLFGDTEPAQADDDTPADAPDDEFGGVDDAGNAHAGHAQSTQPEPTPAATADGDWTTDTEQYVDVGESGDDGGRLMPVTREYDFRHKIPTNANEYHPTNGELDAIKAELKTREHTGQPCRFLLVGETGAGKTTVPKFVSEKIGAPMFTIQGKYALRESDLLGSPQILDDGSTAWTDGVLPKALMASRDGPVVLLIDEVNRARTQAKSVLFSVLDDRCEVTLDKRGGEPVRGNPLNLIVFATMNEGRAYKTQDLDLAERRRLGGTVFEIDYLGREHPERERDLIVERTPAGTNLAEHMVEVANAVRDSANDDASDVPLGIPTSELLSWASRAASYAMAGMEAPVLTAAQNTFVKSLYDAGSERDTVQGIVEARVDESTPFNDDEFAAWRQGK